MKAIVSAQTAGAGAQMYPLIKVYTDSAIGRDVMPVFVPDMEIGWHISVMLAVRILRLGKGFSEKFSLRYIDAIGLIAALTPDHHDPRSKDFIESGMLSIMDSALTTGRWIEGDITTLETVKVQVNDEMRCFNLQDLKIAHRLASIAKISTVKTGDLLIFEDTAFTMPAIVNQNIACSIDDIPCLRLKIK